MIVEREKCKKFNIFIQMRELRGKREKVYICAYFSNIHHSYFFIREVKNVK